jgi:hypothetical protein
MNDLIFDPDAFKEYIEWQAEDRKTLKKNKCAYRGHSTQRTTEWYR